MTLREASKLLGVHTGTLRRYVRQGMPTVELGSVGRGHGTQVNLEHAKLWIAQQAVPTINATKHDDTLHRMAVALYDCLKRDDLAARTHISEAQAALCVLLIFERCYRNLHQSPLTADCLPEQLRCYRSIVLDSMELGIFPSSRR